MLVRNVGASPVAWAVGGDVVPFAVTATTTPIGPGEEGAIEVTLDRADLAEGDISRRLAVTSPDTADPDTGGGVELLATVERDPVVVVAEPSGRASCTAGGVFVRAAVVDESAISSIVLRWTGPGEPGEAELTEGPRGWVGRLDHGGVGGPRAFTVVASDARGNVGLTTATVIVSGC